MAVWSTEAANRLIALSREAGAPLTHMQLQKLVYIAHGWNLAIHDERLTLDNPKAWRFGPVYELLWERLRYAGTQQITREITGGSVFPHAKADAGIFTENAEKAIELVHGDYAKYEAFQLSALTHASGTPWKKIYNGGRGKFRIIPADMIREHFISLASAG